MKKFKGLLQWKHLYDGALMGATLLAPGLSVGTIALVAGFYEQLIDAINDFFSSKWKEAIKILIPIGIGAVIALFLSSRIISYSLIYFPNQTNFLFLGLVIGAIPLLLKTANAKENFKKKHFLILIGVAILIASLNWLNIEETAILDQLTIAAIIKLVVSGIVTGAAMLLPGLSASLILLILGSHGVLTQALSAFNVPIILLFGMGFVVGLILSSKGLKYLLTKHLDFTYAVSIGMIFGSIIVIHPGFTTNIMEVITCMITFGIGFFGVTRLNRGEESITKRKEKLLTAN